MRGYFSLHVLLEFEYIATVLQTVASLRQQIWQCKRNPCVVWLQAKFCSTVANDVMLDTSVGVVRMWADETSRLSRFRMLFTSFADREFFSHLSFYILDSGLISAAVTSRIPKQHPPVVMPQHCSLPETLVAMENVLNSVTENKSLIQLAFGTNAIQPYPRLNRNGWIYFYSFQ